MVIFIGHIGEVLGIHIGRIRDDQIETLTGQLIETIALYGIDTVIETMMLDIAIGHFERIEGDIRQHHLGVQKLIGAGNTDATRAGTHIQNPRRLLRQPGLEAPLDKLTDGRTGNQYTLIDDEWQTAEPGLPKQVSGGYAVHNSTTQQLLKMFALIVLQAAIEVAIGDFPRQVQCTQHQLPRLVPGVVGTMAVKQLPGMKLADSPANIIAQRTQSG